MPIVTTRRSYNGFDAKVHRLGLGALLEDVEAVLAGFRLFVEERRHANGTRGIRQQIDAGFESRGGWTITKVGGVDWIKEISGRTMGVEVQVSGRSDMLAVDVLHLRNEMQAGRIDVGVIVVPDDHLSRWLTDRTPNMRTAARHIDDEMAVQVVAFGHEGTGPALPKMVTNLGRPGGQDG
ncbi:MAG: hypothetical protein OXC29_08400 [Rhodococcus sp.]|nr:hypothetical protein [Rhodococcus sp. (in: high G+C Gram-positive bacteria)]